MMIRTTLKFHLLTLATIAIAVTVGCTQTVEGQWVTFNEQTGAPLSVVEISRRGQTIEGRVAEILLAPHQGEDPVCTRCGGDRKGKKVIGMNILWGFVVRKGSWTTGSILDPETGDVYSGKFWMVNDSTLQVRGYGGPFDLFYRTQTWKRIGVNVSGMPTGLWRTIDDRWQMVKSIVEIIEVDGELKGFVRKLFTLPHEGQDPVCTECEGELRNSRIVGMRILWGFSLQDDVWAGGKILDPGNGNVYASSIQLINATTLSVRGYLGSFYRSQVWKRRE